MEVYLIRHTTPAVEKGVCYGQTDLELATSFATEAKEVLAKLPLSFDKVYSSPLKRCSQLAMIIDTTFTTEDRLKEFNFGDWEMKRWDDIPLAEIQPWYDDFVHTPALNGESYMEMSNRVNSFVEELKGMDFKSIALVCHSAVIRSIIAKHKKIELKDSFSDITVDYGEVIKMEI